MSNIMLYCASIGSHALLCLQLVSTGVRVALFHKHRIKDTQTTYLMSDNNILWAWEKSSLKILRKNDGRAKWERKSDRQRKQ